MSDGARVCMVVGARPNFMKTAPVHRALKSQMPEAEIRLVHTGQHYDERMSQVFFDELGMPEPDVFLGVGSGTHGEQTARTLLAVEELLLGWQADLIVVAGDVNSTLAAALAAVKLHIPVAHIESGLRSFDERMPEEHNRRLTDHLSSVLLAHSDSAIENLDREGISRERVHLVGNTMIDSLLEHLPSALERRPWAEFDLADGEYALVTLHRPALVDDPTLLRATIAGLAELSQQLPVLFPVHPRTRGRISEIGTPDDERLRLVEPVGYLPFLGLQARACMVLTDSGGVQEETSVLGVPCFTLRDSTERPITTTAGTNTLLGVHPELIGDLPARLNSRHPAPDIPLWDGHAGERAATVLAAFLRGDGTAPRPAE